MVDYDSDKKGVNNSLWCCRIASPSLWSGLSVISNLGAKPCFLSRGAFGFSSAAITPSITAASPNGNKGLAQNLQKLHDYVSRVKATWEEFR